MVESEKRRRTEVEDFEGSVLILNLVQAMYPISVFFLGRRRDERGD